MEKFIIIDFSEKISINKRQNIITNIFKRVIYEFLVKYIKKFVNNKECLIEVKNINLY
jgi:hypothetical protein